MQDVLYAVGGHEEEGSDVTAERLSEDGLRWEMLSFNFSQPINTAALVLL